ncbi:hypothetical protein HMPREF9104_02168 [Lentilactobacillus kisonensis F0435]|uniref:Uncharacterized protein n=1 Tax=Lentilactobacillus kisonensis F0435 TaxID=797516 RepID=H1LHS8_9LACO|nr:hypothetical protein HMPREF9104_02168 [Lentilactobacillus kisonensis F0435]
MADFNKSCYLRNKSTLTKTFHNRLNDAADTSTALIHQPN